jgi:hypothetical protein
MGLKLEGNSSAKDAYSSITENFAGVLPRDDSPDRCLLL